MTRSESVVGVSSGTIKTPARRRRLLIVAAFLALLLYPLSAGPVMWLYVHILPRTAIQSIIFVYGPISDVQGPLGSALAWYVSLWADPNAFADKARPPSG